MRRRQALVSILAGITLSGCQTQTVVKEAPGQVQPGVIATGSLSPSATPDASARPAQGPVLTITTPQGTQTWTGDELLAHKDLETLTIPDQATYKGQTMTFKAIPITALFQRVDRGMDIEFDTLDGFSASLDPELLLNRDSKGAIAYLAVEEPGKPWPKLGKGGTAGPLYLVWKNPELSKVGQEQWPYQLRSFTIKPPLEQRFPEVLPASDLADDDPARLGYEVFVKNCFACHTLNGQGNGRLGPDLNIPHSPTEYLHEEYLRKLVRNPQSVRQWKGSKMSAFSEENLPDRDLDLIIAYLKHKAAQRRAAK